MKLPLSSFLFKRRGGCREPGQGGWSDRTLQWSVSVPKLREKVALPRQCEGKASTMLSLFAYLSKKIAIPNSCNLQCLAWNHEQEWIACGGDDGLLKVLKLETQPQGPSGQLSMNQTLEGHKDQIFVCTWNESYRKLTTSDQHGLIIVWMLHKGMWFEEMINNRNKSFVKDMKWTADGQKICIIYEDGAVIVGSVDGNRLWGKELNLQLAKVQWSPDARIILFCTVQGECHIYDSNGNAVSKVPTSSLQRGGHSAVIGGIDWYSGGGHADVERMTLAICTEDGKLQLMKSENDMSYAVLDTQMRVSGIAWNPSGTVLAIYGKQKRDVEGSAGSVVSFFSYTGHHMKTMKVPGSGVKSLCWDGTGLRVAMAVESFIYFANIKPPTLWGYMTGTLVYGYSRPARFDHCVTFWHLESGERTIKFVKRLVCLATFRDFCLLVTENVEKNSCTALLCNAIGSPIETKTIKMNATFVAMSNTFAVVASKSLVYVWNFADPISKLSNGDSSMHESIRSIIGDERIFHIEEKPSPQIGDINAIPISDKETDNPITAVAVSETCMLVGRSNGTINKYSLPHLKFETSKSVTGKPVKLTINCNSTTAACIDSQGVLTVFLIKSGSNILQAKSQDQPASLERKDVWDVMWSNDDPNLCAVMEKNRMYIFRSFEPEEPIVSIADLCWFENLQVKSVKLDELMKNPDAPDFQLIVNHDTKALRDVQQILKSTSISDAYSFIKDNAHPILWKLLANHSLKQLDFVMADKAFVQCADYHGIQFVKQLRLLEDRKLQMADVAVYFKKFNEAEELYLECGRPDLAIDLRTKLGDWFKVEKLIMAGGGNDKLLREAWNKIGDYYSDRQMLQKAVQFYAQAKNTERVVECLYALEDYEALEKLIFTLPEGNPLLDNIGAKLTSVGLCKEAVKAYTKSANSDMAIKCCILLNQWEEAIFLAERFQVSHIEHLLARYAHHLMKKQKFFQAIELYRKAKKHGETASILIRAAREEVKKMANPCRAKKYYVMVALEMEAMRHASMHSAVGASASQAADVIDGLLNMNVLSTETHGNPWHGAEALHFWLLAHQFLYSGNLEGAMRVALLLREYEDILKAQDIYSLVALTCFYNKFYGSTSKAFTKLESISDTSDMDRNAFSELAMSIFTRFKPIDPRSVRESGGRRLSLGATNGHQDAAQNREICIASGRTIKDSKWIRCDTCKHSMLLMEIKGLKHCPLCHASLQAKSSGEKSSKPSTKTPASLPDSESRFKNIFDKVM